MGFKTTAGLIPVISFSCDNTRYCLRKGEIDIIMVLDYDFLPGSRTNFAKAAGRVHVECKAELSSFK